MEAYNRSKCICQSISSSDILASDFTDSEGSPNPRRKWLEFFKLRAAAATEDMDVSRPKVPHLMIVS